MAAVRPVRCRAQARLAQTRRTRMPGAAAPTLRPGVPRPAQPLNLVVGQQRHVLPRMSSPRVPAPRVERVWCSGDTLYAWLQLGGAADWPVSTGDVAVQPRVEVVVDSATRTVVSWDDDPALEMHLRSRRHGLAWWELRWSGASGGRYRVRIPGGGGPDSDAVKCATW